MKTALAAFALMAATSLHAQSFSYTDFSSVSGLQLNGSTFQNGNKPSLTPAAGWQGGSAFSNTPITLGSSAAFSTVFSFEILARGGLGGGADGLTFTVQNVSSNVGGAGGGIGYAGISNSVAVEFDTFDNGEVGGSNHVGIDVNGSMASVASTGFLTPDFDNGSIWWAWVDYNGATQQFEVRWSQTSLRPTLPMLSTTLNLASILGSSSAYVGFTSGTGAGWGEHNIRSWNFVNEYRDGGAPDPGVVPEPATIGLTLTGLVALSAAARRRRKA
jgi:hypothetical protein